ncbi:nuclear transport factor 2 family protein [Roseovarius aestuarii]|nr:nuclear transport factor 2 family protein [Roseovarius aestuarii]
MAYGPQENIDRLHRFVYEVLNTCNLDKISETVSPDFARHDAVRVENGHDDMRRFLIERHADYDKLEWHLDQCVALGNYVTAKVSATGIHRKSGKHVTGQGLALARFENGLLAEVTSEFDRSNHPEQ